MVDQSRNDNSLCRGPSVAEREFELPGLKCGNCGERLPRVTLTEPIPGLIVRDRRCPSCGYSNKTSETVISWGPVRKHFSG